MTSPIRLDDLECIETGFARLYRSPDEVFKVRKPLRISLGDEQVDLSTPDLRRAAIREEQRVSDQLAPEVVRGVVPLTRRPDEALVFGGGEVPIDWALRMQRLPDADRADLRLAAGTLEESHLRAVAQRLARFHERARGGTALAPDAVLERLRARIGLRIEAPDWPRRTPLPEEVARVEAGLRELLGAQAGPLLARARSDSIREGHGELALEHVFVDDAGDVRILAGLELRPRLREGDVTADVALLAADLAIRHRVDLAERFVAEYARLANDFDLYPLLDFHASLLASVRAKLDWLCADASPPGSKREALYRTRARRFLALALAAPRRALLPPIAVVLGGQVASGKSTVALHIARRIGAPIVGSDPTRDYLLGARLNQDLHEARWEESFEPGFGERVYEEVLRRAGEVLRSERPVVIDGCFRSREQRRQARALAARFGIPILFVEAHVTAEVQLERLEERAVRDGVPVDDWKEIADRLRERWEPATELDEAEYLRLDTSQPLERNAARIEERLPTWPAGLTG